MSSTSNSRRHRGRIWALSVALVCSAGLSQAAEWKIETVDEGGSGRFTSMKVDKNGNVHVVYNPQVDSMPLRYAYWDHAVDKWFTMTVAKNTSFCTMVLDSKQRPHISYATFGTGRGAKLHYLRWQGGATWEDTPVSPAGDGVVGYYTSIALDDKDAPNFSYYDYEGPAGSGFTLRLRSVFWNGKYWEVRMVDRGSGSGKFNSIALDSKGRPMIAYANVKAETSSLRFATWDGDNWKTETLEGIHGSETTYSVAMVLDKNDVPHITFSNVNTGLVKYATRRNGEWQIEAVDRISKVGYPDRNGIALDDNGNVYMSYFDAGDGVLKIATRRDGKWYIEILARDYAGFTSSLQVHEGTLWVAFADDSAGSLKVAHRPLEIPVPLPPAPSAAPKPMSKLER